MDQARPAEIDHQTDEDTSAKTGIIKRRGLAFFAFRNHMFLTDEDVAISIEARNLGRYAAAQSCQDDSKDVGNRSVTEELTSKARHILAAQFRIKKGQGRHGTGTAAGHAGSTDIKEPFSGPKANQLSANVAGNKSHDLAANDGW